MAAPKVTPKKPEAPPVPAGFAIEKVKDGYTVTDPSGAQHSGYETIAAALDRCAALCWYRERADLIANPKVSPALREVIMATPFGKPLPVVA